MQERAQQGTTASALAFAACVLCCASLVLSAGLAAPHVSLDLTSGFVLGYVAVAAEIVALAVLAPLLAARPLMLSLALAAVALASLLGLSATAWSGALLTIALGGGVTLLGAALGARTEKPGQLAAVAAVSAIADLWSVLDPSAPSARLAEQAMAQPEQLALFALPFPLLGSELVPALIGAGDVLFAALYVAAFRVHGLSVVRVAVALAAGFALGLLGLLITLAPLPLLPLLGAAVVLSEPAARSLTRREWRTVLLVCAVLVGAIGLRISR